MKRRTGWVVALAVVVLGGCSGPKVPLQIGSKTVATNVDFGNPKVQSAPETSSLPETAPGVAQPAVGGFVVVPPRRSLAAAPRPPAEQAACPSASPLAVPAKEAVNTVDTLAPAGAYLFRVSGQRTQGSTNSSYPQTVERRVGAAQANSDGSRQFDVTENLLGVQTTTTYLTTSSEISLKKVVRTGGAITPNFEPVPSVRLLPLPPQQADPAGQPVNTWRSAGTDPRSGRSMTIEGTVRKRERVDACGNLVDGWTADATYRIVGPLEDLTYTVRTNFATQYGGLIVAEQQTVTGSLDGSPYQSSLTATINSVPPG